MYDNNELEIISYFKYLGLIFSQTGSFAKGIQEIVSSARRALFGLKRMLSRNNEITIKLQIELFDLMIAPILFYGAEIWGFCKAEPIERFHLSFLKSLLGVRIALLIASFTVNLESCRYILRENSELLNFGLEY